MVFKISFFPLSVLLFGYSVTGVKIIFIAVTKILFEKETARCGKIISGSARIQDETLRAQELART